MRNVFISLLAGAVCLQAAVADDEVLSLLKTGREASSIGKYDDAERYHRLAVDAARRSGEVSRIAEAVGDLGGILLQRGQYDESKRLCLESLGMFRRAGPSRYMLVVLNNLSTLSSLRRDFSGAEKYLKDALDLLERLDRRDPYRVRLLNNLGVLYYSMDDRASAERTLKKNIAFIEKELGQDRPELVTSLTNLGGLYVLRKKYNDAEALFERALHLLATSVHANHLEVAGVLDNFGLLDLVRNHLHESEKALRRAYAIRLEVLGPKHPHVGRSAAHLASTLVAAGKYAAAESFYNEALAIYESAPGGDVLEVTTSLEGLARIFRKTNREGQAQQLQAKADSIRFEVTHTVRADQLQKELQKQ